MFRITRGLWRLEGAWSSGYVRPGSHKPPKCLLGCVCKLVQASFLHRPGPCSRKWSPVTRQQGGIWSIEIQSGVANSLRSISRERVSAFKDDTPSVENE